MPALPLLFRFKDDGLVPNNAALPVLIYKTAPVLSGNVTPADAIEKMFAANGWGRDLWRDGIYPFVHYHAMIHEALGIARGSARVQLGGRSGETFTLEPGDIVILPAGTGHQRLVGSDNLLVIGGYPPEGRYDLCRGDNAAEREHALTTIPNVPVPRTDPVLGADGLPQLWRR
jgi:uncharacterized protein YjlB